MTPGKKATYTVELKETTRIPEHAFNEIQRLIEKHLNVESVTRTHRDCAETDEMSPGIRLVIALRNAATPLVEECNAILKDQAPSEARSALGIPRIDLGELDEAPWTSYKTKKAAEPGEPAWIKNPAHFDKFEAPHVIIELQNALTEAEGHRLQLGDMTYFFSGEGNFIARRPAKRESVKGN